MTTLYIRDGSEFREAMDDEIIACAQAAISKRFPTGITPLSHPDLTEAFLRIHLGGLDHEIFGMLHLDSHNRLIASENLFRGTLDASAVYTRDVVHSALIHRAKNVIFFHNHPSGVPEPSQADKMITERLKQSLALIEVRVLDHLIVAETIYSFSRAGLL